MAVRKMFIDDIDVVTHNGETRYGLSKKTKAEWIAHLNWLNDDLKRKKYFLHKVQSQINKGLKYSKKAGPLPLKKYHDYYVGAIRGQRDVIDSVKYRISKMTAHHKRTR